VTTPRNRALAGLAALTLAPALLAPPALAATKAPKHLTAALAAKYIRAEVTAGFAMPGDKFLITACHAIRRDVYTCKVTLVPVQSNSRPHWTNTVSLSHGKVVITYSKIINT
jgi:hypothetical protein